MAPEDVLSSIDESRREFLKKVIGGTVFAVPLMASFSMDGLSLDAAEATHISNMPGNFQQPGAPFCSNLTYAGPKEFGAFLFSDETRVHARAKFKVSNDRLKYEFKLPEGVLFQSARINVDLGGVAVGRVNLQEQKGFIGEGTFTGGTGMCGLNTLLEEMAAGAAMVSLMTTDEDEIEGSIEPVF
jgi:hypothetical protein